MGEVGPTACGRTGVTPPRCINSRCSCCLSSLTSSSFDISCRMLSMMKDTTSESVVSTAHESEYTSTCQLTANSSQVSSAASGSGSGTSMGRERKQGEERTDDEIECREI